MFQVGPLSSSLSRANILGAFAGFCSGMGVCGACSGVSGASGRVLLGSVVVFSVGCSGVGSGVPVGGFSGGPLVVGLAAGAGSSS